MTITLRGHRDRAVAEVLGGDERNAELSAFLTRYPHARLEDDFQVIRVRFEHGRDSVVGGSS